MHVKSIAKNKSTGIPDGVLKLEYISSQDGIEDWALLWPGENIKVWVVFIHGHGSHGDQLYSEKDICEGWLKPFISLNYGILTPNLRGNAWMSPKAVSDMHDLIGFLRNNYKAEKFIFFSGSMGGTSSLIYATLFPDEVNAVISLAAATDLASYFNWCRDRYTGITKEIADAIEIAYGGSPDQVPEIYKQHSTLKNRPRLTMPIFLAHGSHDEIIPVSQAQQLFQLMSTKRNFVYKEISGCPHAIPNAIVKEGIDWLKSVI